MAIQARGFSDPQGATIESGTICRTSVVWEPRVPIIEFEGGGVMECLKCQGLMVYMTFYDFFESCHAWKCVNCGAIIDKLIALHRKRLVEVKPFKVANHTKMTSEVAL